jgi:hypothetical protein
MASQAHKSIGVCKGLYTVCCACVLIKDCMYINFRRNEHETYKKSRENFLQILLNFLLEFFVRITV